MKFSINIRKQMVHDSCRKVNKSACVQMALINSFKIEEMRLNTSHDRNTTYIFDDD
jgi:hypothetical protein